MDVEEHDIHDLFDDEVEEDGRHGGYDEAIEVLEPGKKKSGASFELGPESPSADGEGGRVNDKAEEAKPKRVIRNPMPKLNPERITGIRGIGCLENVFENFEPKGQGHEFEDLEAVLRRMEHWAHRLYPKLPFSDVTNRIAVVGKKMAVQSYVKKLRLGMVHALQDKELNSDDEDGGQDTTQRYADENRINDDDMFERIIRDSEEIESATTTMTNEQQERMLKNRQVAEERKRQKVAAASSSQALSTQSQSQPHGKACSFGGFMPDNVSAPAGDVDIDKVPMGDVAMVNVSAKDAPHGNTPSDDDHVDDVNADVNATPTGDVGADEVPVDDAPMLTASAKDAPHDYTTSDYNHVDDVNADANDVGIDEAPMDDVPIINASA